MRPEHVSVASFINNPVFIVLLALALSRAGAAVLTWRTRDPAPPLDGKVYAFPGFDPIAKQTAILETAWAAVLPLAAAAVDLRQKAEPLLAWNRMILLSAAVAAIVCSVLAGAYRRSQSLGLASGAVLPVEPASGHNYIFVGSGVNDKWLYSANHRLASFVTGTVATIFAALVLAV